MSPDKNHGLREFFLRMTRQACGELGLRDAKIVRYLADLLTDFARADQLYRLHAASGARLDSLSQMLAARSIVEPVAPARDDARLDALPPGTPPHHLARQRAFRRYLGDYSLFMSGLFRHHVECRGALELYFEQGRHSYWKVSELDLALYNTGFLLFQDLSRKFEYYSGALDYMRKTHFAASPGAHPFADFLKEVERWIGVGISSN